MEKVITKLKDPLSKREKELGKLDSEIKQFKGKINLEEKYNGRKDLLVLFALWSMKLNQYLFRLILILTY